ncbi:MAG: hypothetical protein V1813_00930 [Candidatus Aenigmatarchaeota archaeon]
MNALEKTAFVLFALALLASPADAVPSIDISVEPVFHEGDTIAFSYVLVSQQDESIKYLANVDCAGSPGALLELQELDLKANEPFAGEYVYGIAGEDAKSGRCFASVSIIEPYELEVTEPFEVVTPLEFSFDVSFCKTSSCAQESKVFVLGEDVYVRYASGAENPSVEATLTLPDKTSRQLSLPATVRVEQVGTYELVATASKEGYRTATESLQFGVIESEADIPYTGTGHGDSGGEDTELDLGYVLLAAAVAAVLAVVIGIFFFYRRGRKPKAA